MSVQRGPSVVGRCTWTPQIRGQLRRCQVVKLRSPNLQIIVYGDSLEFHWHFILRNLVWPAEPVRRRIGRPWNVGRPETFNADLFAYQGYLGAKKVQRRCRARQTLRCSQGHQAVALHLKLHVAGLQFFRPMFEGQQHR